jgi:pimeloyl-ACP methyl ester carboxylesterase
MKEQKIVLNNSCGQKIVGLLIDYGKDFIVVHCHGYGSNKNSLTAVNLKERLKGNKISFAAFDFSDSGESECKQSNLTVSKGLDELDCVIKYLEKLGFENFSLSGASFGGGVVLNYAIDNPNIKSIILKSSVSDWSEVVDGLSSDFLEDAKKYQIYDNANKINCPVLIIHGDKDEVVPFAQSKKTCSLIKDCQLITIENGDHHLTDNSDLFLHKVLKFIKDNR